MTVPDRNDKYASLAFPKGFNEFIKLSFESVTDLSNILTPPNFEIFTPLL